MWYDQVLLPLDPARYIRDDNFICSRRLLKKAPTGDFSWRDSQLKQRSLVPYTTTHMETELASAKIAAFLGDYDLAKGGLILELGCNDGRITELLLRHGAGQVAAADIDSNNVRLLCQTQGEHRERLLGIVEEAENLPLRPACAQAIVAWSLFSLLADIPGTLERVLLYLQPGGFLLTADPTLESALIYALARNDLEEFINCFTSSSRAAVWEEKSVRYRLYTQKTFARLMTHPNLRLLAQDGISIFPSLIFGGLLQERNASAAEKEKLARLIADLAAADLVAYRQVINIYQKTGNA
jgi:SAM-dependent methyltransferase